MLIDRKNELDAEQEKSRKLFAENIKLKQINTKLESEILRLKVKY
jgi:hypothetical protein